MLYVRQNRLAAGMKILECYTLWENRQFRRHRRMCPPELFRRVVLQGQRKNSGYGSAMSTGAAKGYKFAAYSNAAVINMPAAGMGIRERRRMAERFFR